MADGSRWLIVVQQQELDLYHHLRDRFGELPFLDIVLDRRKGERRQAGAPVRADLRRGDRRQSDTPKDRERWALFGYRLVRPPGPPSG